MDQDRSRSIPTDAANTRPVPRYAEGLVAPRLDLSTWYTARQAAGFLGVTEATVKGYCRNETLNAKQVGPKSQWQIKGSDIQKLREQWRLEDSDR